ncbi:uncharacterized protein BO72DRAFT_39977 [Aspergillus fijiensis CBS 313.89]|uniref:Uncharacterized protein n=1 Tax=Aspergillus fijiensis CBS 313.89 TaxID=1448319 RepID=A0A8G1VTB9_9EURO|nr:uncharacterized protein BO72DRAFT_39977 [Aspergillus fijiensis CBS 313.89]RAK70923.1 hypothetical protein BO72DRAFT_39977 [Aspergillus fijiensis CBS 313.89]
MAFERRCEVGRLEDCSRKYVRSFALLLCSCLSGMIPRGVVGGGGKDKREGKKSQTGFVVPSHRRTKTERCICPPLFLAVQKKNQESKREKKEEKKLLT